MVRNTETFAFPVRGDERGSLVAVEALETVPFEIRRIYYIYGVPAGARRGFHSHSNLKQALVCLSGSVSILVDDGERSEVVELSDPSRALLVGPMVWREMFDFTEDAVLLVLASEHYDPDDYIKEYDEFVLRAAALRGTQEQGE